MGVRGKKLNLNALKCIIEEIYSIKYLSGSNQEQNEDGEESNSFPIFVYNFLTNKYTKKPMVDQHSLDLIYSVDYYRNNNTEIEMFFKFLNEEYDNEDLNFFLYVRSCIENEVKSTFMECSRAGLKKGNFENEESKKFNLSVKSCLSIANAIFGNEEEDLLSSFMEKIDAILSEQKKLNEETSNSIEAWKILKITLDDYHHDKEMRNEGLENPNKNENDIKFDDNLEENKIKNESFGINNNSDTYYNLQRHFGMGDIVNEEDKEERIKAIICEYIKEKELDVFFGRLLSSYSNYEKSNKQIEEILESNKIIVSKKVNILIGFIFERNDAGFLKSLKSEPNNRETLQYFTKLTEYIEEMMSYEKLTDIKEELIEGFAQTLLSTPELSTQINKLVLKRFE